MASPASPATLDPEIFDDLFHGCAFLAFVEEARIARGSPCPNLTRSRAYRYYEEALAAKNRAACDVDCS